MRIGIDIDDTISESTKAYKEMVIEYCTENDITIDQFNSNKDYELDCLKKKGVDHIKNIPVKEGAVDVINKLYSNNSIIIITARGSEYFKNMFDFQKLTEEWLKDNNICYDEYYGNVYGEGKANICKSKKIDLMIDDDINNYNRIKEMGIPVKLFDDYNLHLDNEDRVECWKDIDKLF